MDRNTPELYRSQKSEQSEKPWKKPITWSTIEILQSAWKGLFRLDDISLSSHREALVDFKTACSRPTPPAGQGGKSRTRMSAHQELWSCCLYPWCCWCCWCWHSKEVYGIPYYKHPNCLCMALPLHHDISWPTGCQKITQITQPSVFWFQLAGPLLV